MLEGAILSMAFFRSSSTPPSYSIVVTAPVDPLQGQDGSGNRIRRKEREAYRDPFLPGQGTKPGIFFLFVNHDSIARGRQRVGEEVVEPDLLTCRGARPMGDAAPTGVKLTKEMEQKEKKLTGTV
jgi:hypothetical protein